MIKIHYIWSSIDIRSKVRTIILSPVTTWFLKEELFLLLYRSSLSSPTSSYHVFLHSKRYRSTTSSNSHVHLLHRSHRKLMSKSFLLSNNFNVCISGVFTNATLKSPSFSTLTIPPLLFLDGGLSNVPSSSSFFSHQ